MYPVLAKAATATTPMDFTLTNNQAYFDFLKCVMLLIRVLAPRQNAHCIVCHGRNNYSTVTLKTSRGKKVRLRLPDPSPHLGGT
jgi:hypothetical protein